MSPYDPRPEGLNTDPAPPSVVETLKPLRRCAAGRDGECWHAASRRLPVAIAHLIPETRMPDHKTVTFDASQWQLVPKKVT
ncbi:hypothetical protein EJ774_21300, partial [Pandoraea apista]